MKLFTKVSLICGGVLALAVILCSLLLLLQSKNSILNLTYEQARSKQASLAASFSEMAGYYAVESDPAVTRNTLVAYCFSRFADQDTVLMHKGEPVYSHIALLPTEYLPIASYAQQQYTGLIDNRDILITGSQVTIQNEVYLVYVVTDITPVHNGIAAMARRFALIGFAALVIGVAFIVFLVREATEPLLSLRASTRRIASGTYGERAVVRTRDEVGALAEDFNAMAAAIQQHVYELTETTVRQRLFIGGVTHEFKTPLTTMLLNVDTLQNTYLTEEEREQSLAHIERQCKWLERMTQKLLKLIVLHEQIEPRSASVPLMLERVQESMAETLRERGTPLLIDCSMDTFFMDADLMQSALINLIDNASKASQPGQPIVVKAQGTMMEVMDHGCGIEESALEHIMEPFYMVDKSRSKVYGGSGLGLALVKEIVSAHGAAVRIDSKADEGTTVRIDFAR